MIEQLIPRRKFRIQSKEFGNQWQTISYQKKASDVELEGGETVQHRIDNLVAKITELSTVIRNFKAQEGTDHDAFKRRIGLLYEQIRSGIGGVYNTFLTIEAEGEGAEDYNRLSGEFNTFQNQTRTKLTQLEAEVEELLSYEPDAEGGAEKVDAYDYLDKLIDELEEYMSLVLTQLAQVIGDGDITDVLLNANVDITDQTDTSLAAALKIQHGKISGLETMMNQMGVGNPPYIWERYEYSSSDDPTTCPVKVTAMTNTGDTTTYVPVWRVVFFYQPVFKLLKMTGYMGVSGTGTLDRSVYLSMDVETNKLRFFYTLLDNYERYQWINQDENGVISTVLDQYIDPRQGLLRNGYDTTTVLRVEQWSGLSLPSYYNFNYLGISMGDTGDTAYNPSGFSVWDSGLPEKPLNVDLTPIIGWGNHYVIRNNNIENTIELNNIINLPDRVYYPVIIIQYIGTEDSPKIQGVGQYDYFDLCNIVFNKGQNNEYSRTIKLFSSSSTTRFIGINDSLHYVPIATMFSGTNRYNVNYNNKTGEARASLLLDITKASIPTTGASLTDCEIIKNNLNNSESSYRVAPWNSYSHYQLRSISPPDQIFSNFDNNYEEDFHQQLSSYPHYKNGQLSHNKVSIEWLCNDLNSNDFIFGISYNTYYEITHPGIIPLPYSVIIWDKTTRSMQTSPFPNQDLITVLVSELWYNQYDTWRSENNLSFDAISISNNNNTYLPAQGLNGLNSSVFIFNSQETIPVFRKTVPNGYRAMVFEATTTYYPELTTIPIPENIGDAMMLISP